LTCCSPSVFHVLIQILPHPDHNLFSVLPLTRLCFSLATQEPVSTPPICVVVNSNFWMVSRPLFVNPSLFTAFLSLSSQLDFFPFQGERPLVPLIQLKPIPAQWRSGFGFGAIPVYRFTAASFGRFFFASFSLTPYFPSPAMTGAPFRHPLIPPKVTCFPNRCPPQKRVPQSSLSFF